MRLPTEAWWQTWQRLLAEASPRSPQGTPEPKELTAWEASQAFTRVSSQFDKLRRSHRRSRHRRRR
jgi:hypothetical protein